MLSRLQRSAAVLWICVMVISCLVSISKLYKEQIIIFKLNFVVHIHHQAAPDASDQATFRRARDPIIQLNNTVEFDAPPTNLERNPFLQWISGIFGTTTTTTEKPIVQVAPQNCEPCGIAILVDSYIYIYIFSFLVNFYNSDSSYTPPPPKSAEL